MKVCPTLMPAPCSTAVLPLVWPGLACSCLLWISALALCIVEHTHIQRDICILRLELAFSGAQIPLLFMLVPWTGFSCAAPLSIVCSFLLHTLGLAWIVNSPPPYPSSLHHPLRVNRQRCCDGLEGAPQKTQLQILYRAVVSRLISSISSPSSREAAPLCFVVVLSLGLVIFSAWQRICFDKILIAVCAALLL